MKGQQAIFNHQPYKGQNDIEVFKSKDGLIVDSNNEIVAKFAADYDNFDSSFQLSSIDNHGEISHNSQDCSRTQQIANGQSAELRKFRNKAEIFQTQDQRIYQTRQPPAVVSQNLNWAKPNLINQNTIQPPPFVGIPNYVYNQHRFASPQPIQVVQPQLDLAQLHILASLIVQKQQQATGTLNSPNQTSNSKQVLLQRSTSPHHVQENFQYVCQNFDTPYRSNFNHFKQLQSKDLQQIHNEDISMRQVSQLPQPQQQKIPTDPSGMFFSSINDQTEISDEIQNQQRGYNQSIMSPHNWPRNETKKSLTASQASFSSKKNDSKTMNQVKPKVYQQSPVKSEKKQQFSQKPSNTQQKCQNTRKPFTSIKNTISQQFQQFQRQSQQLTKPKTMQQPAIKHKSPKKERKQVQVCRDARPTISPSDYMQTSDPTRVFNSVENQSQTESSYQNSCIDLKTNSPQFNTFNAQIFKQNTEEIDTIEPSVIIFSSQKTKTIREQQDSERLSDSSNHVTAYRQLPEQFKLNTLPEVSSILELQSQYEQQMSRLGDITVSTFDEKQNQSKEICKSQLTTRYESQLYEELEALRQQRDAQEILIQNLRSQIELGELRAQTLFKMNEDLNAQIDIDMCQDSLTQKQVDEKQNEVCTCKVHQCQKANLIQLNHKTAEVKVDGGMSDVNGLEKSTPKSKIINEFIKLEESPKKETTAFSLSSIAEDPQQKSTDDENSQTIMEEQQHKQFQLIFPRKYHNEQLFGEVLEQIVKSDGRVISRFKHKTDILFPTGIKREQFDDGYFVIYFENGDVRQTFPDGKVVYLFAEAGVTQTELSSGERVLLFKNGQLEKHMPDGSKKIIFVDGSAKFISSDGVEEDILGPTVQEDSLLRI